MVSSSSWTLSPAYHGRRLDVVVTLLVEDLSRARAQQWIDRGLVEINGRTGRASYRCREGDELNVRIPEPTPAEPRPEDIPLDIVHEDEWILVVNKPPGIVVHPSAGHPHGTLVNALLHHCTDLSGVGDVLRPGIVHRLDRETSGLMVVAKNDLAHSSLARQFQERLVHKTYLALVYGAFPRELSLTNPIGRDRRVRTKMSSRTDHPKQARSEAKRKHLLCAASLVAITILTGRTHQIRVHLSEAGYPLAGDVDYPGSKPPPKSSDERKAVAILSRFGRVALHAAELGFHHPKTDGPMQFSLDLPSDMAELVNKLEKLTVND